MGNNASTAGEDKVSVSRRIYIEKLALYEKLEAVNNAQKLAIETLTRETEQLGYKLRTIELENSIKDKENQSLKSELSKYESLPVIISTLNMYTQIKELQTDITESLNTKPDNNGHEIFEEIDRLRKNVNNIKRTLPNNELNNLPDMRTTELQQLEREVKSEQANITENKDKKQVKLEELLAILKRMKDNIPESIGKTLFKINKEITSTRNVFNDIQSNSVHPACTRLKGIYMEQENLLLKHKLNLARPCNLVFCNIPEQCEDYKGDYEKVKEILQLFHGLSDLNVKVTRVGRSVLNKQRLVKVTFANADDVELVMRYKYKLKGSAYSAIRIYPDKYENV